MTLTQIAADIPKQWMHIISLPYYIILLRICSPSPNLPAGAVEAFEQTSFACF